MLILGASFNRVIFPAIFIYFYFTFVNDNKKAMSELEYFLCSSASLAIVTWKVSFAYFFLFFIAPGPTIGTARDTCGEGGGGN